MTVSAWSISGPLASTIVIAEQALTRIVADVPEYSWSTSTGIPAIVASIENSLLGALPYVLDLFAREVHPWFVGCRANSSMEKGAKAVNSGLPDGTACRNVAGNARRKTGEVTFSDERSGCADHGRPS